MDDREGWRERVMLATRDDDDDDDDDIKARFDNTQNNSKCRLFDDSDKIFGSCQRAEKAVEHEGKSDTNCI